MFTGIIEGIGTVRQCRPDGRAARLAIDLGNLAEGVKAGDSVAVDGACLTAADIHGPVVEFDLSAETLARTTLGFLRSADKVNIERALRLGDRLGGHIVLGHVDVVGTIARMEQSPAQLTLVVAAPRELIAKLVYKGSVAVSGISLTVAELHESAFSVAIIPYTLRNTTLPHKTAGDKVNIELDIIGKYVERLLAPHQAHGAGGDLTERFLEEHGFK